MCKKTMLLGIMTYVCTTILTYFLMMSFDGEKKSEDFIWCLQFDEKKNETKNLSKKIVVLHAKYQNKQKQTQGCLSKIENMKSILSHF